MMDDFDYSLQDEEAILKILAGLLAPVPKNTMWIINPTNYGRILDSVKKILDVVRKVSPNAQHEIRFDEITGTGLCLTVRGWCFGFYGCQDLAAVISLADTLDIEATLDGAVEFVFGFNDARIPIKEAT